MQCVSTGHAVEDVSSGTVLGSRQLQGHHAKCISLTDMLSGMHVHVHVWWRNDYLLAAVVSPFAEVICHLVGVPTCLLVSLQAVLQ